MSKAKSLLIFFLLNFFLASCHYQLPTVTKCGLPISIFISEIENDDLGYIRSSIICSLAQRNILTSLEENTTSHKLCISLINYNSDNIGFTCTSKTKSANKKDIFLVSNEGRLSITAHVLLLNNQNQPIFNTNCCVETFFDFEPDLAQTSVHNFSLGQMSMYNENKNTAEIVLLEKLGSTIGKIVSYEIY